MPPTTKKLLFSNNWQASFEFQTWKSSDFGLKLCCVKIIWYHHDVCCWCVHLTMVLFLLNGLNEIVIDANMDLQWPHRLSLMPPSLTCSALDPLQSGFVPWRTLYPVDKVPIPTRLDLVATTLLKMLMVLKTLKMVLKPLWMMVKPYMGWRSINDPFYGHSCSDGVMVPQKKPSYPTGDIMLDHVVKMVK